VGGTGAAASSTCSLVGASRLNHAAPAARAEPLPAQQPCASSPAAPGHRSLTLPCATPAAASEQGDRYQRTNTIASVAGLAQELNANHPMAKRCDAPAAHSCAGQGAGSARARPAQQRPRPPQPWGRCHGLRGALPHSQGPRKPQPLDLDLAPIPHATDGCHISTATAWPFTTTSRQERARWSAASTW
jgi:hypothetical protein